jgi:membrane protease YdiL (CAAX protease family)
LAYVVLYYVAWEFYFRGYLLFSLKKDFGALSAVLIQTISSCLIHIGKPEGEILGSIPVGILFGIIALRTRSFWYVFVLHAALGVLTDLFVLIRS